MALTRVAISLGSNLGDRLAMLRKGWTGLGEMLSEPLVSSVYVSRPMYVLDQPEFLNACCVGWTALAPGELLEELQRAERAAGRVASGIRHGPRPLDLDLLLYDDRVIRSESLTVPHPRLPERAFVLIPLAELAASWSVPGTGLTVGELAAHADAGAVTLTGWSLTDER